MFVDIQGYLINTERINVVWLKKVNKNLKILLDFNGSNSSSFDDSTCISLNYDEDFLKFISEIDYFLCDIDDYTEKKVDEQEIYALNLNLLGCIYHKNKALSDQRLKIDFFVKKIFRRLIVKKFE